MCHDLLYISVYLQMCNVLMEYQMICKLMDISGYHNLGILRHDDTDFSV